MENENDNSSVKDGSLTENEIIIQTLKIDLNELLARFILYSNLNPEELKKIKAEKLKEALSLDLLAFKNFLVFLNGENRVGTSMEEIKEKASNVVGINSATIPKEDFPLCILGKPEIIKNDIKLDSSFLQKTNTFDTTWEIGSDVPGSYLLSFILEEIKTREFKNGNKEVIVDECIIEDFQKQVIIRQKSNLSATTYRLLHDITNGELIEKSEEVGIKKTGGNLQSFLILRSAILLGEVDCKGTELSIYFKQKADATHFVDWRYRAYRDETGGLSISKSKVDFEARLSAKDALLWL